MSVRFEDVLMNAGETGALMANMDWSKHALGPIERWPVALRSALSICLSSKTPILVSWSAELIGFHNDAYRPVVGRDKPQALGARGDEIWPEIWHIMHPIFNNVLAGGPATDHKDTFVLLERNGFQQETYFNHAHCPLYAEDGQVAGVFTTLQETTTKVLSERRLRTLSALAQTRSNALSVREACGYTADVLHRNTADVPYCLIFGVQGHAFSLFGSAGAAVDSLARSDHALLPLAQAIDAGEPLVADSSIAAEFTQRCQHEGRSAPERACMLPVRSHASGQPEAVLVCGLSPHLDFDDAYRDFLTLAANQLGATLANARAVEDQRQDIRAQEELERAKSSFFSHISHGFRTPLTLILGAVEAALTGPYQGMSDDDLKTLHQNALRLSRLVNMLLDLGRLEGGLLTADFRQVDLATLTQQCATTFESAFQQAGVQLTLDCPQLPQATYVDPELWEEVLMNLLSNALKFTLDGEVRVSLRQVGHTAQLQVRDTGVGIAEAELPKLFTRFYRAPGSQPRTHEGSGLGLCLTRDLVRLHGGTLHVDSELDAGSVFTIRIPLGGAHLLQPRAQRRAGGTTLERARRRAAEALSWQPSVQAQPDRVPQRTASDAPRLLIVENSADMRAYLTHLLAADYALLMCEDETRALRLARAHTPDLIVADATNSDLNAVSLVRELRASKRTRALPVLLLSALAGEDARVQGFEAGADDHLVKPFYARELLARVALHVTLGRTLRTARSSQQQLREIVQQAPVAVALLRGPHFVFELANTRLEQLISRHDMVGRTAREIFSEIAPDAPIERVLRHVRTTGRSVSASEFRLTLDREGSGHLEDAYFMVTCQPLGERHLPAHRIIAVAFEVTEQVKLHRRIEALSQEREYLLTQEQQARATAEAANRVKDEFLAVLGHELRNPLAPITTALALMRQNGPLGHEAVIIERQVGHLTRLVEDLLDVSRITRGKVELKSKPLNLAGVVREAVELASPLLEEREQHLDLDVPSSGLDVLGDRTRLAQVLANLLTNASKYSDRAGHIAVRGRQLPDDDAVEISVRDHGIGIASDMLEHVWNAFTQGAQAIDRSRGGLGLGLTIVRSLVALHGGSVAAHSDGKDKGSEFRVRLPRLHQEQRRVAELPAQPTSQPGGVFEGHKILLVDDNEDAAELLAEWFRTRGALVETASDGLTALKAAKHFKPEVALLDLGLPAMNGYEVARRLRAEEGNGDLVLVAVTGYGEQSARNETRAAGFDEHCVKPLDLNQFEPLLRARLSDRSKT